MMRNMFAGAFGGPGGGWGGHAFGVPSASSFNQTYTAFSTAILEIDQGKGSARHGMAGSGRDNVNFGGKSALVYPSPLRWDAYETAARSHHAALRPADPQCVRSSCFGLCKRRTAHTAQMDIESPWMFQLTNPRDTSVKTHAGVLEFIASEGNVHLPQWVCERALPSSIDLCRFITHR
jgi:ubiquitin fusion degradation protein 1